MAYRNGTYIAFHAGGTTDPTASDIKYYRLLKAWHVNDDIDFKFINSHEKVSAVRDTSKKTTLIASLRRRLNNSKNMVLILGPRTRFDTDWVPFEIGYAVDQCGIPLIVVYPGYDWITAPAELSGLWPLAFLRRVENGAVRAIHIPFRQRVVDAAIRQFSISNMPPTSLGYYSREAYRSLGIEIQ
ncbi:TIR domain-containing protein [Parvibaculum sp.]|uniref:TIR domain-containing protein n=1 Tax=Parvibaculum sp. TaxID=2024848 RepID=UPI003918AE9A